MSKRKEKISAFLDNDMHRDELMSFSLSAEVDDAKIAQRYQIVGDALRGELSDSSFIDVSQAVREALANENIAEQMSAQKLSTQTSAALSSAKSNENEKTNAGSSASGLFDWSSLFKPAAGMAAAVLVAVVMVFSLSEQGDDFAPGVVAVQDADKQGTNNQGNNIDIAEQGKAQFRTVANVENTKTAPVNTLLNTADMNDANVGNKRATQMSPYINQHLDFARQDTLQGRMPYVRAVSFENKTK